MEANLDLAAMSREWWPKLGTLASPSALLAMTPLELMALFSQERDTDDGERDQLAELRRVNHEVRAPKGLPPSVPFWLLKEAKRGDERIGYRNRPLHGSGH